MLPFCRSRNGFRGPCRAAIVALAAALGALGALTALPAGSARAAAAHAPDPDPRAHAAEYLPSDHPAWADLETLWNLGGLSKLPLSTRPLARIDIAAALVETLRELPDLDGTAPARRLQREFRFERLRLGDEASPESGPLIEVEGDGALLRIRSEIRGSWRVDDGRGEIVPGSIVAASGSVYLPGRTFVRAELGLERIVDTEGIGDSIVKGSEAFLSVRQSYLSFRTAPLDLVFGLGRNRWGSGTSGTLLLSDAALPYAQIQFGRTYGRVRFVALTAPLHLPEQRWFSAHRIEIAVGSRLRLGVSEAAAYSSSSLDLLYGIGIIPYTLVQRIHDRTLSEDGNNGAHRNNLAISGDFAWRIGRGFRLDGELMIDDLATESASQPDRIGWLAGVAWTGPLAGSTADARIEYAKVYRWAYAVFYGANLIHDGVPLGYGRGPDVEHALAVLERDFSPAVRLGLGCDWNRRGASEVGDYWDPDDGQSRGAGSELTEPVEDRFYPHLIGRFTWRDVAWIRVRAGALRVENEAHVEGEDRTGFLSQIDLTWRW